MAKVAIYSRVSTSHQTTDLQAEELEKYVKARGWTDFKHFTDVASGTTSARAGLKALMAAARTRKIDVIVIWKLDRLFRSLKDLVNTITELEELGVALISIKDQIDLTTSTGRLLIHLLGSFAQFEADLIRSRVCAGLERAKRQGKRLGRPRVHDEDAIRQLRDRGLSYSQIQKRLGVSKGAVCRALKDYPTNPQKLATVSSRKQGGENE